MRKAHGERAAQAKSKDSKFVVDMSTSSSSEGISSPELVSESKGSSVSTELREEYEDLLRYAVVTPVLNVSAGGVLPNTKTKKSNSSGPPPRKSPPPRPHTPPRHVTRSEMKAKG